MYDRGHFCLLVCPQGKWEEKTKKKLYEDIISRFLSLLFPRNEKEAHKMMWDSIEKSPLFEPTPAEECSICYFLNKIFEEKNEDKGGFILFSHNILDLISFKFFFSPILENNQIKEIFYLELDSESQRDFLNRKDIQLKQINSDELFDLKDKDLFEMGIIYMIMTNDTFRVKPLTR